MRIKLITVLFIILCPLLIYSRSLEEIKRSGVIYGAFTESALNSINYQFALEFAKFLNVKLVVVPMTWNETFSKNGILVENYITDPNISHTPDALKKADFMVGTIYVIDWREKFFDYAGIMWVSDLLVVRKEKKVSPITAMLIPPEYLQKGEISVKTYQDLKGLNIAFLPNSTYETNIKAINEKIGGGIIFQPTKSDDESQKYLIEGKSDGFISVSYLALDFLSKNKDDFRLAFPIAQPQKVGWAVENNNDELKTEIDYFFETIKGSGKLDLIFKNAYNYDYSTYLEIINSYAQAQTTATRDLDEIQESGKLIVALREREMVYHSIGKKQFSQYLAEEFARYLKLDLELVIAKDLPQYFETKEGNIVKDSAYLPEWFNHFDVACDLFEAVPWRMNKIDIIDFVPNAQIVVGRRDTEIKSINDLRKYRGVTSKSSSYEEALLSYGISNYYYSGGDLFSDVVSKKADYTIASFSIFSLPNYEELEAKFVLGEIGKIGWGIKKNQPKLRQKILEFIEYAKNLGILDDAFKNQTGMPFKAAENYLTALYETYQTGVFPFVFYGTNDGLPQEDIISIFQDKEGYIWFSNNSGAVKFNGRTMRVYNSDDGLNSNNVFDINQDKTGKLYFATLRGISVFNGDKFTNYFNGISFKHIFIDKDDNKWFFGDNGIFIITSDNQQKQLNREIPALPMNIHSIAQDKDGRKTFIASSEGLYLLNHNNELSKLSNDYCLYAFVDEDDKVWVSTTNGLYYGNKFNFASGNFGLRINEKINIGNNQIERIQQTDDGAIWLISSFKVFQLYTLKQKPIIYDKNVGLSDHRILSFLVDNENNYWFGYSGGIQKLTTRSLRILYPEIMNSYINSIVEDSEDRIWFGANNNVYYLKDRLINFSNILAGENKPYAIAVMKNKNLIIASNDGIFEVDKTKLNVVNKNIFSDKLFHIESVFISSTGEIFILTGIDGLIYYLPDFKSTPRKLENSSTTLVYQLVEYQGKIIGANNTGLVSFNGKTFERLKNFDFAAWSLCVVDSILYIGTEQGLGIYKNQELKLLNIKLVNKTINAISKADEPNHLWIGTNQGFSYLNLSNNRIEFTTDDKDGLPGNEIAINGIFKDIKGLIWVGTYHGVATFDIKKKKEAKHTPQCRIERILMNGNEVSTMPNRLKYNENTFIFELTGLSFKDEKSLEYDFFMKGLDNDFGASVGKDHRANYPNLPPGDYEFVYRTKGKDGIWSYYNSLKFTITKPFWREWWFLTICGITFLIIVWLIIKWRGYTLQKRNEQLEQMVLERTAEIMRQKDMIEQKNVELEQQQEEIMAQRDELEIQRDQVIRQRDEIARQQKDIMDSIYYAKRIQTAILPPSRIIAQSLPDHFVLYKPRDVVSGDFYWLKHKGDLTIVVAADCTGHGVPGAFMSMLGSAFLSEIAGKYNEDNIAANLMLNDLRSHIVESLHQTGRIDEAKDGMDIILSIINIRTLKVQFSGAFNPLYVVQNGVIEEYRTDRMPIGISDNLSQSFANNEMQLSKGDTIYMFSDGYASQFGGPLGKKFMSQRMKKLLGSIQHRPLEEQHKILDEEIIGWMGEKYEQVDDILIIGVKI